MPEALLGNNACPGFSNSPAHVIGVENFPGKILILANQLLVLSVGGPLNCFDSEEFKSCDSSVKLNYFDCKTVNAIGSLLEFIINSIESAHWQS